ncbi:hypothetical protein [Oscillatoria salina]|uniref:hypothetical protein n=1 Tax=Oscillatoria salina TaxID=331517 RepID=UPI0013BA57BF|nr:hypothetical protein [Oscillatoria salina]MBZ8180691.1 hypothetical protein [Oscillatoria salina IIICB1]NET91192.1 hypothetical protein [Kamptonema sp. SIO1D9]
MEKLARHSLQQILVPVAVVTVLLVAGTTSGKAQPTIQLRNQSNFTPISSPGQSGGSVDSKNCGFVARSPNQVLNVTERIDYLRVRVEATGGEPTLLVDGPDGRFCVLADEISGDSPEISGVWLPGRYSVYVGDRSGSRYDYTLYVSQQSND